MIKNSRIIGTNVNSELYHTQEHERGTPGFFMSPSALKEFARCPRRWKDGYEPPESKAKDAGNLFDCLLLTPGQFEHRYAIKPDTYYNEKEGTDKAWNANSTVCKEWLAEHSDFECVSKEEIDEASEAIAKLQKDDVIREFLANSDRQVLLNAEWHDGATGLVIPIRCLMDLVPRVGTEFAKSLGDLKSTRNAGLTAFRRDCHKMGYHIQAAFDMDLYVEATKEDRVNWCLILLENFKPWQTGKRLLAQDFLDIGRADYRRALTSYAACVKTDHWPDYDENDESVQGWTLVAPEPWMASEGQFAPRLPSYEEYLAAQKKAAGDEPPEENDDVPH